MSEKQGKELASISIYLNTGIVAGLITLGFLSSSLLFGILLIFLK